MKVAIIHYWLVGMRGGEKVLEAFCQMYPQADLFTHVVSPDSITDEIKAHRIRTSFISRLPQPARWYKRYLPLMPLALEHLDLRGYDLILSSESGPAKGIVPPPGSIHICYCHSPMRYIWNMYHDYRNGGDFFSRIAMPVLSHYMRMWDESSAARVDGFVANSRNVAERIRRYYRREAQVVHPPVDVDAFELAPPQEVGDEYLMVGELVRYKRPDLAVEAFNMSGRRLTVIGGGEMLGELKRLAGPNVTVLGPQPFGVLRHHYARCRALIFPGEEDFGIVPVEAMASGRPVVAFGRGGALETVIDRVTGILFHRQSVESLNAAIDTLDGLSFEPSVLRTHANRFTIGRFKQQMHVAIDRYASLERGVVQNAASMPPEAGLGRAFA
ncbi:glycosyltransferase [Methylobacterium nodulans]|uniref:Glycosyl transferase group 1 n=1 Tax=Methylobacterium nodulans (strain LMG 21967 / CNCM I-2342 / ORS 2060) TaxID=460265 RepID=B8IGI3_METNO|nr:glycosyltransferase [Methylobacterium nodulans]ACL55883.1 glycosyl transferase group 1 [Methylobacterium nodulans ORS 2060]